MTRVKPFALCRLAQVQGAWYFKVVSLHTTSRAALTAGAVPATFGGRIYRVRDTRTGRWVEELDGRPGVPEPVTGEVREVPA